MSPVVQEQVSEALISTLRRVGPAQSSVAANVFEIVERQTHCGLPDIQRVLYDLMSRGEIRLGPGLTLTLTTT